MTLTAAEVFRKYAVDGVPASGVQQVSKAEASAWGTYLESLLNGSTAGLLYLQLAYLNGDILHPQNTTAIVVGDPNPANNGLYVKSGASGAGFWTRIDDLPNPIVRLTVTGGTANAITATAPESPTVPGAKLYLLTPTASNTTATTITVNGGAPVAIKNAFGFDLASGSLVTGSQVLMAWQTDHYQLLISAVVDGSSILASCVSSASAAATSATSASTSAAALGNQVHQYDTRAQAAAATIPVGVQAVKVTRYAAGHPASFAVYIPGTSSGPNAFQEAGGHYWELDLTGGVIFASWFGAIGDDTTNDYTALQAGMTAAVTAKVEFHLNPGRKYYVSSGDLTLSVPSGCMNFWFYGNGAQIRTDPTQARTGLIVQHGTAVTRSDENRMVLVSGLTINHFNNSNALFGINVIGSTHVTIANCSFLAGSDTGTANYTNYAGIAFSQSNALNPDTGSFWCRALNNTFKAGSTPMPHCIWLPGGSNAVTIENNTFSNATVGVWFTAPSTGLNGNEAVIANGVRITNNDFEGVQFGIYVQGTSGWSHLEGLIASNNRIETTGTVFFNYLLNVAAFTPPIIGPNYIDSGSWPPKYVASANGLVIDVRDEFVNSSVQNPGSLAAGSTFTLSPITVNGTVTGDEVRVEVNGDLQGIIATGYVSAANTVTIRCSNPTGGAIDLPSLKWYVRVRPQC